MAGACLSDIQTSWRRYHADRDVAVRLLQELGRR
jgi:hypothetical protein